MHILLLCIYRNGENWLGPYGKTQALTEHNQTARLTSLAFTLSQDLNPQKSLNPNEQTLGTYGTLIEH